MIAGITSALSGLQANQLAFDATADNLANLDTPGYQALRVNQNAAPDGGVSTSLSADPTPVLATSADGDTIQLSNVDPVTEAVNSIAARAGYTANLKSIEAGNEMLKKTYQLL